MDLGKNIHQKSNSSRMDDRKISSQYRRPKKGLRCETKPNKEVLKNAGFMWSSQKEMWYFRPKSQKKRYYGNHQNSIDEIRAKYGSEKINSRFLKHSRKRVL